MEEFQNLSKNEEAIASMVVDAAFKVHTSLGPGLLEKVYEICFCHELTKHNISFRRQVEIPIIYDGLIFNDGLRLDVLVDERIICELKAVNEMNPLWEAQILSYLKLSHKRLGFIINFNVPVIKKGIRRIIL
jgi:GxxExxY protein